MPNYALRYQMVQLDVFICRATIKTASFIHDFYVFNIFAQFLTIFP